MDNLTESQQRLVMRTNIIQLNTDMGKVKGTLYDGTANELPLVERTRNLEKFQSAIQFWFRTIAVALVLQTITFAIAVVVAVIRLLPLLERLSTQP